MFGEFGSRLWCWHLRFGGFLGWRVYRFFGVLPLGGASFICPAFRVSPAEHPCSTSAMFLLTVLRGSLGVTIGLCVQLKKRLQSGCANAHALQTVTGDLCKMQL